MHIERTDTHTHQPNYSTPLCIELWTWAGNLSSSCAPVQIATPGLRICRSFFEDSFKAINEI